MNLNKGFVDQSNLECFLHSTTPIVPSQFLPKTATRNLNKIWYPWDTERIEYFTLGDLWRCFDEWSVYGVGVPIVLSKAETVVQYYVPYLSAIQIFTSSSPLTSFQREGSGSGDSEPKDSSSDSCSDESGSEKSWRWDGGSCNDTWLEQERLFQNDRLGYLYFQDWENSAPYGRVPLMDKVNGLAQRCHGLMTLRSIDLSPASWMSVAWYPIYHIPTGRTVKDLSTCFLTFHTLSSSFQDTNGEEVMGVSERKTRKGEGVPLSPFGLATYKLQGNVWLSGEDGGDQDRLQSLFSAADSWLKQLRVQHHDFNYFTGIRNG